MEHEKSAEEQLEDIHQLVEDIESQLAHLRQKVRDLGPIDELRRIKERAEEYGSTGGSGNEKIVEGVFDGQNMVGPDGKIYTVPANYASKSKLVEGDIMKLTIAPDGSFIYKQIGPVDRQRVTGTLVRNDAGSFRATTSQGRSYRLLTASVTYFRGEPNDTVVMLVPQDMESKWAAVENIVKAGDEYEDGEYDDADEALPLGDEMELESGDDAMLPPPRRHDD